MTADANHTSQAAASSPAAPLITRSAGGTHRCSSPSNTPHLPGNVSKKLSHSSVMSRTSSFVCRVCVYQCVTERVHREVGELMRVCRGSGGGAGGGGATHMWLVEPTRCIEGEASTSAAGAHRRSPSRAPVSRTPSPRCPMSSALCVSRLLSPTCMASHLVPPPPPHSPSFLAAVVVTFINGEFMCLTGLKPEPWLRPPQ